MVLAADDVHGEIQRFDVGSHIRLLLQMTDDLLHGLAGEVGTEHIDLVGHSAVDEIVPQVDAVFLAEGLIHAVHKAQILPYHRRGKHHAEESAVGQRAYLQLRHQLLCLPQLRVVEGDEGESVGEPGGADCIQHPGHKVGVVLQWAFQFQLHLRALHAGAELQRFLQRGDPLVGVDGIFPAAKIQGLQLAHGQVVDLAGDVGVHIHHIVVVDDQLVVVGLLYIHFHAVCADLHRLAEGDQRVLRGQIGCTAVRNDLGCRHLVL